MSLFPKLKLVCVGCSRTSWVHYFMTLRYVVQGRRILGSIFIDSVLCPFYASPAGDDRVVSYTLHNQDWRYTIG